MANDFLRFAGDVNANVMDQADYLAAAFRASGFEAGIAQSEQLNKVWRQAAFVAHCLAQYMTNQTGQDVLDDQDVNAFLATLQAAIVTGSGLKPARVVTLSVNIDIDLTDYAIAFNRTVGVAALTATLPAAQNGQEFVLEDTVGNFFAAPVTVVPQVGDTIANEAQFVLNQNKQSAIFRYYASANLWSVAS